MTETPSPEDRAPTEPETPETTPKASEGNGDPAHPTPEEATAEAAVAADAPGLDTVDPQTPTDDHRDPSRSWQDTWRKWNFSRRSTG